ncbi:hypothetical protein ME121_0315 [Methylobacterium sp. ME121]|nr:hypothetical protein ME121_0315 [Methylobacterium sp. ME121]
MEVIRPSAVADPDRDDGSRIDRLEGARSFTGAPLSARVATLRLDVLERFRFGLSRLGGVHAALGG